MIAKNVWGEIVKDFQERNIPEIIEREAEYPTGTPLKRAVVFVGPRRCGKTYSMFQLMKKLLKVGVQKKNMLYVNFEDSRLSGAKLDDLNGLLEAFFEIYPENKTRKSYFFLDEIQTIERWEMFARRLIDSENVQLFITGSSSKLMSKEIATSMRGRSLTYRVFPFSFREFLSANGIKYGKYLSGAEKAKLLNRLREYMEYGGYPETIVYKEERERILSEIMDVTIYRDIVERYKVKNPKILRVFFAALFNSKEFSVHKFFNFLKSQGMKISKNSLYNYLEYFRDSLIVYPLRKFSYSYKEAESSIPKIYFVDNGLLRLQGIRENGRLMENLVFTELERKWGNRIFYYKSLDGKEVDFLIKEGAKIRQLIQACYDISDFNTKERELGALLKASEELKCKNLLVITWDYEGSEKKGGKKIVYVPLWKWLLEK